MTLDDIQKITAFSAKQGVIFYHYGSFPEQFLVILGELITTKLKTDKVEQDVVHRLFFTIVEQVQNISRYSAEKANDDEKERGSSGRGAIIVGHESDEQSRYYICSTNKILHKNADRLKSFLNEINSLDNKQLKVMYKKRLREESDAESLGAGVGFIEMARKSEWPLEFGFQNIDNQYDLFFIKTYIRDTRP